MVYRILIILCFSTPSLAQEINTQYKFYGFSDDPKYCAFEMFSGSIMDGETPAYSYMYFIDVDKNEYAIRPIYTELKEDSDLALDKVRSMNRAKAAPYFKQYKISGGNTGNILYSFDTKAYRNAYDTTLLEEGGFTILNLMINSKEYSFRLSTVGTGNVDYLDRPEVMAVADVIHQGKVKVLQPATKAPKSWGMIIGYQILEVYVLENKIAIFLEYQGPGFEGYPDRQQMIVSGVLPGL